MAAAPSAAAAGEAAPGGGGDAGLPLAGDGRVPGVVAPPRHPLDEARLFDPDTGLPRLDVLRRHLLAEGRLEMGAALRLVREAAAALDALPNVLRLSFPVTVVGDIHGQFFDLEGLFAVGGPVGATQYLFLGDYVDRGCFSTEVVFYLFALRAVYPGAVHMLRGNHECRHLTAFFNFRDECTYKYGVALYDAIMHAFDRLPIAAVVDNQFFCVHGGLSPSVATVAEVEALDRRREVPKEGPLCDLLWADPFDPEGEAALPDAASGEAAAAGGRGGAPPPPPPPGDGAWFTPNAMRQCSYHYGVEAVKRFLKTNRLAAIVRAHEAQAQGYKMHMVSPTTRSPRVITVFSAPNYCDVYKNLGSCFMLDKKKLNIRQFVSSDHPYYLPNFMNAFEWSLPFLAEKVTDMLSGVLTHGAADGDEDGDEAAPPSVIEERGKRLRQKILAVSRLVRMYKRVREHNEALVQLGQLVPNSHAPFRLAGAAESEIQQAVASFETVRLADAENERMPGDAAAAAAAAGAGAEAEADALAAPAGGEQDEAPAAADE